MGQMEVIEHALVVENHIADKGNQTHSLLHDVIGIKYCIWGDNE